MSAMDADHEALAELERVRNFRLGMLLGSR
jgi:hypothetical protein